MEHRQAVTPRLPSIDGGAISDAMPVVVAQVKFKNARMLRYMSQLGHKNVQQFCEAHGLAPTAVGDLVNFKAAPRNSRGAWRSIALRVAEHLACEPDDLWPGSFSTHAARNNGCMMELRASETVNPSQIEDIAVCEQKTLIETALNRIGEKPAEVLRMRFGFDPYGEEMTYSEIGERVGLSPDRIRQIEARALRKFRHPCSGLRELVHGDGEG